METVSMMAQELTPCSLTRNLESPPHLHDGLDCIDGHEADAEEAGAH